MSLTSPPKVSFLGHLLCAPKACEDSESIGTNRWPLKSISLASDVSKAQAFTGTRTETFKNINFWVLFDIVLKGSDRTLVSATSWDQQSKNWLWHQLYLRCPEVTGYCLDFAVPSHSVVAKICSTKCEQSWFVIGLWWKKKGVCNKDKKNIYLMSCNDKHRILTSDITKKARMNQQFIN